MGTSGGVPEMQAGNGSAVNPDMAAMRAVYNRYFGFRYRSALAAISGKLPPCCCFHALLYFNCEHLTPVLG